MLLLHKSDSQMSGLGLSLPVQSVILSCMILKIKKLLLQDRTVLWRSGSGARYNRAANLSKYVSNISAGHKHEQKDDGFHRAGQTHYSPRLPKSPRQPQRRHERFQQRQNAQQMLPGRLSVEALRGKHCYFPPRTWSRSVLAPEGRIPADGYHCCHRSTNPHRLHTAIVQSVTAGLRTSA